MFKIKWVLEYDNSILEYLIIRNILKKQKDWLSDTFIKNFVKSYE